MVNKRGVIKTGLVGTLLTIVAFLVFFSLFLSFSSAAIVDEEIYYFGDKVKIDLKDVIDYKLKITTPTTSYFVEGSNEVFVFKVEEIGVYVLDLSYGDEQEVYRFEVVDSEGEIIEEFELRYRRTGSRES